ncbi:MAG: TonB-dependent receptor [Elusimicrobia bacterium]|nr:TonB-dependent receptor [Elusimicrobiota bacterium]
MKKFFVGLVLLGMGVLFAQETTVFIGLRKEVPVEKTATNITVITEDEIEKSDAKTVGEILENKTGVIQVLKYGTLGAHSEINIRGGKDSSKQVLVMVDGRPVNDILGSAAGSANLSEIPTENIERIEVMRGPSSALYGANALGGVVNIITKKAITAKPKTEIGLEYGSFSTKSCKMNFSAKPGKANIFLSGSKNVSDGFRENSEYDGLNLSSKIGYDFDKIGKFGTFINHHNDELGIPGTNKTEIADYDNDKEQTAKTPNQNMKTRKQVYELNYEKKLSDETKLQSKIYFQQKYFRLRDPDSPQKDDIGISDTLGGTIQADTLHNITAGVEGKHDICNKKNEFTKTTVIDKWADTSAIFIQKTFNLERLTATAGTRYDYNNVFGGQLNPRVVNIYKLSDNFKLSSTVGRAFRAPTFDDLYADVPGMGVGNPELKPEKSIGTDFGMEYKLKEILVSKIILFYSDIKNFIQWAKISPTSSIYTPSNVGKVFSRGVEFEIENSSIKNITQNLNYTFLESMGKETGTYKTLQYTPKHRLNYGLNYSAPLEIKTKLGVEYTHKQIWEDWKEHKIPGYTLANLRVSRKILQSEVFFSVENIFDRRYVSRENYPLPGRTYSAGINLYLWD